MARQSAAPAQQAPVVHTEKKSRGTVVVGCKVGVPWIELQLCQAYEKREESLTGARTITEYRRTGKIVRLRGLAYPQGQTPNGFPDRPEIINGAAVNRVDRDFWEAWVEQNKMNSLVTNRMVFAMDDRASLADFTADLKHEKSGLDAIIPDPDQDSRVPRPMHSALTGVGMEDGQKAKVKTRTHESTYQD